MDIKEANQIVCDFLEDKSCMCLVTSLCPSPSSHHENCINESCKKKITHTSYHPYATSLDSLSKAWTKLAENFDAIQLSSFIRGDEFEASISADQEDTVLLHLESEEGRSLQSSYCIATAKFIKKMQEEA